MDLPGKTAIVTGAARGIGRAIAEELARSGARVVMLDSALRADPIEGTSLYLATDVSQREQVEFAFQRTIEEFGSVDILVNNAMVNIRKPLIDLEVEDVRRVWDVGLWGVFHCTQLAARQMVKQSSGAIVSISSVHASRAYPDNTAYNGAKAALNHMTQTWASELAANGITVNAVEPGWIDTPGERAFYSEQQLQEAGREIPMERLGRSSEIAAAVSFLIRASYITGTILRVDGGIVLPRRGSH